MYDEKHYRKQYHCDREDLGQVRYAQSLDAKHFEPGKERKKSMRSRALNECGKIKRRRGEFRRTPGVK